jgi:hypothetical protein
MKVLTIAASALLAMTAVASAQPMQLSATAMDHVAAGAFSIPSLPCLTLSVPTPVIPCPDLHPVTPVIPCPVFGLKLS